MRNPSPPPPSGDTPFCTLGLLTPGLRGRRGGGTEAGSVFKPSFLPLSFLFRIEGGETLIAFSLWIHLLSEWPVLLACLKFLLFSTPFKPSKVLGKKSRGAIFHSHFSLSLPPHHLQNLFPIEKRSTMCVKDLKLVFFDTYVVRRSPVPHLRRLKQAEMH